jgi:F0F1-type ATP synthase membrane subunit a
VLSLLRNTFEIAVNCRKNKGNCKNAKKKGSQKTPLFFVIFFFIFFSGIITIYKLQQNQNLLKKIIRPFFTPKE